MIIRKKTIIFVFTSIVLNISENSLVKANSSIDELFHEARQQYEKKEYLSALDTFAQVLSLDVSHHDSYLWVSRISYIILFKNLSIPEKTTQSYKETFKRFFKKFIKKSDGIAQKEPSFEKIIEDYFKDEYKDFTVFFFSTLCALITDPYDERVYFLISDFLLNYLNDPDGVILMLENLLELKPELKEKSDLIHARFGDAYRLLGKFKKAEESYNKALSMNPMNVDAMNGLAITYFERGKNQEAVNCFHRVLRLDPDNLSAMFYLANYYKKNRMMSELEKINHKIYNLTKEKIEKKELDPIEEIVYYTYYLNSLFFFCDFYLETKDDSKLKKYCEEAEEFVQESRFDFHLPKLLYYKGIVSIKEKDFSKGIEYLYKVKQTIATEDENFYFYLATGLLKSGYLEKALSVVDEGLTVFKESAKLYVVRGKCYEKLKNAFRAASAYERAISLDKGYEEILRKKINELDFKSDVVFDITIEDICPAFLNYYKIKPCTTIWIKNIANKTLTNIKIKLESVKLSSSAVLNIDQLKNNEEKLLKIKLQFSPDIIEVKKQKDEIMKIKITIDDQLIELNESFVIHSRNSIFWWSKDYDDKWRQIAVFVTPNDPLIKEFVENALKGKSVTTLEAARRIFNALHYAGIRYRGDPISTRKGRNLYLPDTPKYPRETLIERSGDCEDLAILYATCLAAAGIEPAFIFEPGHVYVAFRDENEFKPVETTQVDKGFLVALITPYFDRKKKEILGYVRLSEIWNTHPEYTPVDETTSYFTKEIPKVVFKHVVTDKNSLKRKIQETEEEVVSRYGGSPVEFSYHNWVWVSPITGRKWYFKFKSNIEEAINTFVYEFQRIMVDTEYLTSEGRKVYRLEDLPDYCVVFPDPYILDIPTEGEHKLIDMINKQ